MDYLKIEHLNKAFTRSHGSGAPVQVVRELSMSVAQGEILALLGASGSGKTTLLRCIGGLETPDSGSISVAGETLYSNSAGINVPPHLRNMGMVFQSYALWPHLSVSDNIAYPLERRGVASAEIKKRVERYLELVDCAALAERYPHQLSGGQQQRIALARALVAEPHLVLFDEPLSNLDANLREQLRFEIRDLKRRMGFTGVYVTHDHAEAIFVADRIAIIGQGRALQIGNAADLYRAPVNIEIAEFLGMTNSLHGELMQKGEHLVFHSAAGSFIVDATRLPEKLKAGAQVVLKCHPARVSLSPTNVGLPGRVLDRIRISEDGVQYVIELADGAHWQCAGAAADGIDTSSTVHLHAAANHIHLFEDSQ